MSNETNFQLLIPNTMPKSVGYSQLAVVTGGRLVFIAGQVALDKSEMLWATTTSKLKFSRCLKIVETAVEAAGGSFNDVIKLNSIH
jgi:enamine deaminase RidA (YjgF/YER057c/UK114 family)